ncbi:ComE operon protein 3 [Flammeovirgaceae bacterium 311]|nr:ComE operon protein 3 [Flammeovirgaceae bacterium 311]
MQRFIQRTLLMLVMLIGFTYAASAQTVYVTKTGAKYHEDGCRYLSKSKIQTTVKEARAKGFEPCKICKPPVALKTQESLDLFAIVGERSHHHEAKD